MTEKLRSITNLPFLVCLSILLINDFYLKAEYHNWLTGKLSDVCGLYVFASFWTAIVPNWKRTIYFTTAVVFVIWKSPYSQGFIDFFSDHIYVIHRVVDFSDLISLLVLPIGFYYVPNRALRLKLNPVPIAILTVISFCATSVPRPTQVFTQPQYLLFKSGIVEFVDSNHPSNYRVYDLDSLLVIGVKEIQIDERPAIDDEYHKVQILKALDLRLLKDVKEGYAVKGQLNDYKELRDSLIVGERTSLRLRLDSITENLNFVGTRVHGRFSRLSNNGQLLIDGSFKNGVEDSTWSFYDTENQLISRKYFENGELIQTEFFENANLISARNHNTREEMIRNKYFHLAIITLLIITLVSKLALNYKQSTQKDIIQLSSFKKIAGSLGLPIVVFGLAKLVSSLIPNSYSTFFFGIFGEAVLVYIVAAPLFLLVFYFLKLRNWFDLVFYIFLFSLLVVLTEEWIYLRNISY